MDGEDISIVNHPHYAKVCSHPQQDTNTLYKSRQARELMCKIRNSSLRGSDLPGPTLHQGLRNSGECLREPHLPEQCSSEVDVPSRRGQGPPLPQMSDIIQRHSSQKGFSRPPVSEAMQHELARGESDLTQSSLESRLEPNVNHSQRAGSWGLDFEGAVREHQ